jgi:hypothetical protein
MSPTTTPEPSRLGPPIAICPVRFRGPLARMATHAAGQEVGTLSRVLGISRVTVIWDSLNDQGRTVLPRDPGGSERSAHCRRPMRSSQLTMIGATTSACQNACR